MIFYLIKKKQNVKNVNLQKLIEVNIVEFVINVLKNLTIIVYG